MSRVGRVAINRITEVVHPLTPFEDPPPVPVDSSEYLLLIAADGAVGAWPLDEDDATNVYADVIGSSDGVLVNGTTSDLASSGIGPSDGVSSPYFLGTTNTGTTSVENSIVVPPSGLWDVGTGDFALEGWVHHDLMDPATGMAGAVMTLISTDLANNFLCYLAGPVFGDANGKFRCNDTNTITAKSPTGFDDDALHHWVFTRRGGSYYVIIDGNELGSVTPATPVDYTGEVLMLGGVDYDAALPGYFAYTIHGRLAWCAFYNVGLTGTQAMAHYLAGGGL